jgi:excisionase family DNA binding protein
MKRGELKAPPTLLSSAVEIDDRIAVSIAEAVRLSGLGRTFLYSEMAENQLPYITRGRRRLIRLEDLHSYLAR